MRTKGQIEVEIKVVHENIGGLEDGIENLRCDLRTEQYRLSQLEKELFQIQSLNGNPIDVLFPLIPILLERGSGHEIRIVEDAISGELEDLTEWGRIKHLARQFLHITL